MEIGAEKTKQRKWHPDNAQGERIEAGYRYKLQVPRTSCLDDGSKQESLSRFEQATAALSKLRPIRRDNNIFLRLKVKLVRPLVISIFLYACDSWTSTAAFEKRTQTFEKANEHFVQGSCYQ